MKKYDYDKIFPQEQEENLRPKHYLLFNTQEIDHLPESEEEINLLLLKASLDNEED